jgi:hypothetical protein
VDNQQRNHQQPEYDAQEQLRFKVKEDRQWRRRFGH